MNRQEKEPSPVDLQPCVSVQGTILDRPGRVLQAQATLPVIPLSYCVNIQVVGDQLIELYPRVSSFIYQDDLSFPLFCR